MKNIEDLTAEIEKSKKQNALLQQQVAELTARVNWYQEQYRLSRQQRFGSSSEKTISGQLHIFNEAEIESKPDAPEPTVEEITYKRRKRSGKRKSQLKDLPVETIEYRLSEEERICPECGEELHQMSKETRRELKVIPAQVKVVKHERYVYSCRCCESEGIKTPVVTAPMPNPVIPGGLASPSSVSYVINEKYTNGMPLYRQEKQWERLGVKLSRQTMANWIIQTAERWLAHVYRRMREHLLKENIIHADETVLQVLHEPRRAAKTKSYMWLYRTGREGPPIILFDYQTTRAGKHPKEFLKKFKGFVHVDGYNGYKKVSDVTLVGCWSHVRRKYHKAIKALPKKRKKNKLTAAEEGLQFCNRLFAIERKLKDVSPEKRYKARLEDSLPVLKKYYKWLKWHKPRLLPKSAFGEAVTYSLNQWDKLNAFLRDGRLEISNNRAERTIKSFVIGRKAWLFANTTKGADSSAITYSIVESAKENGLNPFAYLKHILRKLPNMNIKDKEELDSVMPWSEKIPDNCKVKK